MRSFIFLFFPIFSKNLVEGTSNIKNRHIQACINCKFYKPIYYNSFDCDMNRCQKYGEKNIINGEIEYDIVSRCRKDDTKCGIEGKSFEEEPNLFIKKLSHNIQRYSTSFYLGFLIVSYLGFFIVYS